MSNPPWTPGASVRHASFSTRRARFLSTAPPTRRPQTNATRVDCSPGDRYSTIRLWGWRAPLPSTRLMSLPLRSRPHRAGALRSRPSIGWYGSLGTRAEDRPNPQAEIRARPLARLRASTARPPRVRIRRRNPWVFLRLRLFGWKVFFTAPPILARRTRSAWTFLLRRSVDDPAANEREEEV